MKERKTSQIITRVTEAERVWVDGTAASFGMSTSTFIRLILRGARQEDALFRGLSPYHPDKQTPVRVPGESANGLLETLEP
jgi:hypothetical protein